MIINQVDKFDFISFYKTFYYCHKTAEEFLSANGGNKKKTEFRK